MPPTHTKNTTRREGGGKNIDGRSSRYHVDETMGYVNRAECIYSDGGKKAGIKGWERRCGKKTLCRVSA
jgi:hypothetical protein